MLHDAGRYDEAVIRLEEAVKRYADLSDTVQARYLLADSCRRIAMTRQDELAKDRSGSSREFQAKRIGEDFEKALAQYRTILEQLGGNRDAADLSDLEKHILRNSYFSVADVLYAEGKYEEAVKAYYIAINRYQNRPEILDAYVQIANAYRRLARPHDAVNALHQAELLLSRMKPEVPFDQTSIYSRGQWSQRLLQLQEIAKRG
jgi:tetratricopeptide (TPR) repeat protein